MNIYFYMNPGIETTSGFPQTKEDSIKLFLPTYDAKLEMFNWSLVEVQQYQVRPNDYCTHYQ